MRPLLTFFSFFLWISSSLFSNESLLFFPTEHVHQTSQGPLPYQAVIGNMPIAMSENNSLSFLAYFVESETPRPITFVFPGGPGGACGVLAICSIGPLRLPLPGETHLPGHTLCNNPQSLLPWTDLVFVDPPETGFSEINEPLELPCSHLSVEGDFYILSSFVHDFLGTFNRWHSPKYLLGNSYGSTRCVGIAEELTFSGIDLEGIILLGTAIDFSSLIGQQNHVLPDALLLPTCAATAWYHGRLFPDRPLEEVLEEARHFVFQSYLPQMLRPGYVDPSSKEKLYEEIAFWTGIPLETVIRYQGRFNEELYTSEFFSNERKVLGGLDTRYKGDPFFNQRFSLIDDPSYKDFKGSHLAFYHYLQNDLDLQVPLCRYAFFVSQPWDWNTYDSVYFPALIQRLQRTLILNPQMKVFVGSGYYDCRTPFAATEYSFDMIDLPPHYRSQISHAYYPAGHGFLFDLPSLKKFQQDLLSWATQ